MRIPMTAMMGRVYGVLFLVLCVLANSAFGGADVLKYEAASLAGNPLADPVERRLVVLSPDGTAASAALPMLIYLPGWGGSADDFVSEGGHASFAQLLRRLAKDSVSMRIAVVDGRSRFGGSQFVNSAATGRYADFVADDTVEFLARRYPWPKERCWVGGHSSGAYGALRLAMDRGEVFRAAIALSPDSHFEVTHKPLVQQPSVRGVKPAEVTASMASGAAFRLPADGLSGLVLGLCANYTPTTAGRFEWLYDDKGAWRSEVWERWIEADPLTLIRKRKNVFRPGQAVYLDGAQFDEFGANIGAKAMYEALQARKALEAGGVFATFHEAPGHHSDRIAERLERGIRWAFGVLNAR